MGPGYQVRRPRRAAPFKLASALPREYLSATYDPRISRFFRLFYDPRISSGGGGLGEGVIGGSIWVSAAPKREHAVFGLKLSVEVWWSFMGRNVRDE